MGLISARASGLSTVLRRVRGWKAQLDVLIAELAEAELPISHQAALWVRALADKLPEEERAFIERVSHFQHALFSEMQSKLVVTMSSSNRGLLEQAVPLFGEAVDDAFPRAAYDITEAGKCLALERWTAAVMHLMRALEHGLAALAAFCGVDFGSDNWNQALNKMEAELRKVGRKTHSPADEQFAAEAVTHFRAIKNAWRNHAQHGKDTYDEERALAIFESVRSFMRHLATRLSA